MLNPSRSSVVHGYVIAALAALAQAQHQTVPELREEREVAPPMTCGVVAAPENDVLLLTRATAAEAGFTGPAYVADVSGVTFHIPIAVHVVRRSNGTGGLSANAVLNILRDANQLFEPAGIHFCEMETIFIDDDSLFDCVCDGEMSLIRSIDRVEDSLNAYFAPRLRSNGQTLCGIGTLPGTGNSGIVMQNSCTAVTGNRSTVSHELGHFLGLLHTHDLRYGAECADGSNCATSGDLICDTSADPNLLGRVSPSCQLLGPTGSNCVGDTASIDPPIDNIMSYARHTCRSRFTPGQIQRMRDVILFDRPELARLECMDPAVPTDRALVRISEGMHGEQANGPSRAPAVAGKGRFVGFISAATNLIDGVDNGIDQVFLHDLETGVLEHISRMPGGGPVDSFCDSVSLSADGRYVVYSSAARGLVPEVPGPMSTGNVYRFDRETGETVLVSRAPDGGGTDGFERNECAVSGDGRYVAFSSRATNLAPVSGWPTPRIYLADVETGSVKLVSTSSLGEPGVGRSQHPTISEDGRYVAFSSFAQNLDPDDADGLSDIFLHDRIEGTTRIVSLDEHGQSGFGQSYAPKLSRNGRFVAFELAASGPWDDDVTNFVFGDIALKDLSNGKLLRVNESSTGIPTVHDSDTVALSANGRFVLFRSEANEFRTPIMPLVDYDVWLKDMRTGEIREISVNTKDSFGPALQSLSMDARARVVAFTSEARNLVPGDTNNVSDVFVRVLGRR